MSYFRKNSPLRPVADWNEYVKEHCSMITYVSLMLSTIYMLMFYYHKSNYNPILLTCESLTIISYSLHDSTKLIQQLQIKFVITGLLKICSHYKISKITKINF